MKNVMCALIALCAMSIPLCVAQDNPDNRIQLANDIQGANDAFAEYASTNSVGDLRKCLEPLMMIRLTNEKAYESYLPQVTQMWLELFREIDNGVDPNFDPNDLKQIPITNNISPANLELLQKSNRYLSLKALDDDATAAFIPFVEYHYRGSEALERLRHVATQQALSPRRIEHILPPQTPSSR
jgi:hypothetical protein